jgi:hypothetical protein
MTLLVSVRWMTPVMVQFGNGAVRKFDCVHDALDCLQHEWPSPRGKEHARAVDRLCAALARLAPPDEARHAFVAACAESEILVPHTVPNSRKVASPFTRNARHSAVTGGVKTGI